MPQRSTVLCVMGRAALAKSWNSGSALKQLSTAVKTLEGWQMEVSGEGRPAQGDPSSAKITYCPNQDLPKDGKSRSSWTLWSRSNVMDKEQRRFSICPDHVGLADYSLVPTGRSLPP